VSASAPAKINLHLGVGPVRADGFHPLATVYQAIGLLDEVTVRHAPANDVTVTGQRRLDLDEIPLDARNAAVRAAMLLAERNGVEEQVAIHIDKQIPVAGGMAGGSADAAAALVACDALWGLSSPREELLELAAELGSDVPFALVGGTAIATGRGESVVPAMVLGEYWWVVVESADGLSTPAVYHEFDTVYAGQRVSQPDLPDALMEALRSHDLERLGVLLRNDLEEPAIRLRPELDDVLAGGIAAGALGALLSGSGPTCVFLCSSRTHAEQVSTVLSEGEPGAVCVVRGPVPGARVERMG